VSLLCIFKRIFGRVGSRLSRRQLVLRLLQRLLVGFCQGLLGLIQAHLRSLRSRVVDFLHLLFSLQSVLGIFLGLGLRGLVLSLFLRLQSFDFRLLPSLDGLLRGFGSRIAGRNGVPCALLSLIEAVLSLPDLVLGVEFFHLDSRVPSVVAQSFRALYVRFRSSLGLSNHGIGTTLSGVEDLLRAALLVCHIELRPCLSVAQQPFVIPPVISLTVQHLVGLLDLGVAEVLGLLDIHGSVCLSFRL